MAFRRAWMGIVLSAWLFGLVGGEQPAFGQGSKPPIVPPSVKSAELPDLDFFAPATKPSSGSDKPAATPKPAPTSDALPQAPRFAPSPPAASPSSQLALPKRNAPTAEAPKEVLATAPSTGKPPEPLPPPIERSEIAKQTPPETESDSPWAKIDANSVYRPLAAVVIEGEARRGSKELSWAASQESPPLPAPTPLPPTVPAPSDVSIPIEDHPDISSPISDPNWADHWLRVAPTSLLWQPPLANPREPRMSAKALRVEGDDVFDAAIGGEFGLIRISPDQHPNEGFQLDLFAAVFSRFRKDDGLAALDYRFGVPLTYAVDCWQYKLAYEHTSNRIQGGAQDLAPDAASGFRREEIVLGIARRWDELFRAYGQVGVTISGSDAQKDDPFRFNLGIEYADYRCTTPSGAPFAALDLEFRGDQDHAANLTLQAGWNWRGKVAGRGPRIAAEYHRGQSPFGQFFAQQQEWYGVAALFDW